MAQWLEWSANNQKVGGSIPTQRNWQLEGCQSTSLSKAPNPGRCDWLPTAPVYDICLYECVTGANLDGLKVEDKFCVCIYVHDNKSDLKRLLALCV